MRLVTIRRTSCDLTNGYIVLHAYLALLLSCLENILFCKRYRPRSCRLFEFFFKLKTLKNGNLYGSRTQPEISAERDETTGEVETGIHEGSKENSIGFSSKLVNERIKASVEPVNAQINALTEMMDRLI